MIYDDVLCVVMDVCVGCVMLMVLMVSVECVFLLMCVCVMVMDDEGWC